jgi:hypothetical protein
LASCDRPQRGLKVGGFQVVSDVAVDVLVVMTLGQIAESPLESLLTRVVVSRRAVAVAAPVAKRLDLLADQADLTNTTPPSPVVM